MQAAGLALAKADIKAIDVAMVQDRVFLCNSMIGLTPELTEQRQRFRGRPISERLAGYADVLLRLWRIRRGLVLKVEDAKKIRLIRALSLVVSNNCATRRSRASYHAGRSSTWVASVFTFQSTAAAPHSWECFSRLRWAVGGATTTSSTCEGGAS
jgi:diacylglycerol kinase family enzyme